MFLFASLFCCWFLFFLFPLRHPNTHIQFILPFVFTYFADFMARLTVSFIFFVAFLCVYFCFLLLPPSFIFSGVDGMACKLTFQCITVQTHIDNTRAHCESYKRAKVNEMKEKQKKKKITIKRQCICVIIIILNVKMDHAVHKHLRSCLCFRSIGIFECFNFSHFCALIATNISVPPKHIVFK